MLNLSISKCDEKLEQWSTSVPGPITIQSHVIQSTNQISAELNRPEQPLAVGELKFVQSTDLKQPHSLVSSQSVQPLSTFVNYHAQSLNVLLDKECHQTGITNSPTDQTHNPLHLFCSSTPNSCNKQSPFRAEKAGQIEEVRQSRTNGSSLTYIPVIPPSPYDVGEDRIVYSSAASDTNSACSTRRHFRRRVANYHQNQRHSSQHHSQPRLINLLTAGSKMRSSSNAQNAPFVSWKNGGSRTTTSLSPPVRCSSGTPDLSSLEKTNLVDVTERRATSVGPPCINSGQKEIKSSGSSDPLQTPSGGESLDILSVDCMINAWTHVDSGQQNRAHSNPLMHSSQTAISPTTPGPGVFTQAMPDKTCAVRSRSHHQLISRDPGESNELTESQAVSATSNVGIPSLCGEGRTSCSNTFYPTCQWQSAPTNDRAFTVLDRWYQRYYTISRNPDNCMTKMLRSPISVLAPCKGK
ncbi:hypothetical protein FBUS_01788 [Fasciolopsis buskii]|uniref:Uncharacterized protein n=1 Tax=Fasciolopsis buskii TaxID=27845 RepID=A0A8E0SAM2_9TREM|nr:hypothetical protein FBUS_01788 [Fasciolopsis buski]